MGTTEEILKDIEGSYEDLAELMLRLGNTNSPFGSEAILARVVHDWYKENGMVANYVPITTDRAATVGLVGENSGGKKIIFNAHLDTEASGPDFDNLMNTPNPNDVGARRDGDNIYGHTVQNDRGCMAMQMVMARAIHRSGIKLAGQLIVISSPGETGAAPVDEFQGSKYVGKGFGTSFLTDHGYRADYAVIAETTDFAASWIQTGAMYLKIIFRGKNMYTPRLLRGKSPLESPNALVRAAIAVGVFEDWAIEFERRRTIETDCGTMRPKAQIGAIRGGIPWRPNRSSTFCALYADIRTLPGEATAGIVQEVRELFASQNLHPEIEIIMEKSGHEAKGENIQHLRNLIAKNHKTIRAQDMPATAEDAVVSMWRDTNVYNSRGIPSLTFGPSRGKAAGQGDGFIRISDFIECAKIYALTAIDISLDKSPS
jgi:acetylornithine deacetylase/succinyl-diaminopimelate desuccinylase-like protein